MNKMLHYLCALALVALSFALLGCGTQNAADGKKSSVSAERST